MSRVIEEKKVIIVVVGAVGLVQQFWNDLDSIQTLEAGVGAPGDWTSFLPGSDISAEKWEILNDWLGTVGPWSGYRTAHFRIPPKFIAAHPTPALWAQQTLRDPKDPLGVFLPQVDEGRVKVGTFNDKPVRKRL